MRMPAIPGMGNLGAMGGMPGLGGGADMDMLRQMEQQMRRK